jgi:transcriptional regulator with XRE-family HTH domain
VFFVRVAFPDNQTSLLAIVAENVRSLAKQKGMTLDGLADFAGVSRRQLYNLLAGKHDVTLGWLEKVAEALDVEPTGLMKSRK